MKEENGQNETWKPIGYDYVVTTIRRNGRCMRWKDVAIEFGEMFDEDAFPQILELALERGDLVKAPLGCVCTPENVEESHPAGDEADEWDSEVW